MKKIIPLLLFVSFLAFGQAVDPPIADDGQAVAAEEVAAPDAEDPFAGVDTRTIVLTLVNTLATTGVLDVLKKKATKAAKRKTRGAKVARFFGSLATSVLLPTAAAAFGIVPAADAAAAAGVGWLGSQGLHNARRAARKVDPQT